LGEEFLLRRRGLLEDLPPKQICVGQPLGQHFDRRAARPVTSDTVDSLLYALQQPRGAGCLREGDQAPAADQLDHPAENAGTQTVAGAMNRATR
jgi:hypothetical protein